MAKRYRSNPTPGPDPGDEDELESKLLHAPGAKLTVALGEPTRGLPLIHILGNRPGMLSLANVLLWLHSNAYRREFLSVSALSFVGTVGSLALSIRVTAGNESRQYGRVRRLENSSQFEWELSEDGLLRLGLAVHRLACKPEHGYDEFPVGDEGDAVVHLELDSNHGA
jgi:hypothetical protein